MYISRPWVINKQDQDTVEILVRELNISRPAAAVLANRGITTSLEAERFMNPDLIDLANPFLLPDIEKGVERIRRAIDLKEKILVYGDRDADGVTSGAGAASGRWRPLPGGRRKWRGLPGTRRSWCRRR